MKSIDANHFKYFKMPGMLRVSPSGRLAFLLHQADLEQNDYTSDLWVCSAGRLKMLPTNGPVQKFWWLDQDTLLFSAKGESSGTRLYRVQADSIQEPDIYADPGRNAEELVPLKEGGFLYTAFSGAPLPHGARREDAADYELITELPFWENGTGFTSGRRQRLFLWDGTDSRPLTDEFTDVEQLRIDPAGLFAYFIANRFENVSGLYNRLLRLDLKTFQTEDLSFSTTFRYEAFALLEDGGLVVMGSDMSAHGLNQNAAFYRIPATGGRPRTLYEGGAYGSENTTCYDLAMPAPISLQASGNKAHWISAFGGSAHLMQIHLDSGDIKRVSLREGAVCEFASTNEMHFFVAFRGLQGPEIYTLDQNGEAPLTTFNQQASEEFTYSVPLPLSVPTTAGMTVEGWVLPPATDDLGTKHPAVLMVHGGPKMTFAPILFHEMQFLSSQGYGVLFCNPRGSDGKGDAFADIRGEYGQGDIKDILTFLDAALAAHSWIDTTRLGISGGSYGGFAVNWITAHHHRFAAAVSQRSISNWTTHYLTTDIGYYFVPDQMDHAHPAPNETFSEYSPLTYLHRSRTPTLFLHSEEDYRCHYVESLQAYTVLRRSGVPTRLCLFRGENHELSRNGKPRHRITRLQEILSWFRAHL